MVTPSLLNKSELVDFWYLYDTDFIYPKINIKIYIALPTFYKNESSIISRMVLDLMLNQKFLRDFQGETF